MASAIYERIFDDVFMMTSAKKPIRSSVFGLYFEGNASVVSLWGLDLDHRRASKHKPNPRRSDLTIYRVTSREKLPFRKELPLVQTFRSGSELLQGSV